MTTVTVYKPDGAIYRMFQDPKTWSFDEKGVFTVVGQPYGGGSNATLRTTLRVTVEQTP
jgi:hypothetical protein